MIGPEMGSERIAPRVIRYVKLGAGGAWAPPSLDEGRLYFGIETDPHDLAAAGDWAAVRNAYLAMGQTPGVATSNTRELRDFYTLSQDCLWITFARGRLWWGFAQEGVQVLPERQPDGRQHYREMIGGWRCSDRAEQPLPMHGLSSSLTQLAGYRRTICDVREKAYLLRILNAEPEPTVAVVQERYEALAEAVGALIARLHWSDFELFVEVLLGRIGWRRISRLGGPQADIDLLVELPATGGRMAVQVKSALDQRAALRCFEALKESDIADGLLVACHSPKKAVVTRNGIEFWDRQALANRAVAQGLTEWLMERCR